MKTAIILVGNVRTWNQCKKNFIETFGTDTDIFIQTYTKQYAYHPWVQRSLNFFDDCILDNVAEMFNGLNVRGQSITDLDEYVNLVVKPGISDKFPADAYQTLAQYFKLNDGILNVRHYESVKGFQYDRIIKTRFDVEYYPFDQDMRNDEVYVDSNGAGVYPCDWILVANRNTSIAINDFIIREIRDPKDATSLDLLPHKLFLNGIRSTTHEPFTRPLIKSIIRASK